jgi:lipase (class 3)
MDNSVVYMMAELSSRAYDNVETLTKLFKASGAIGTRRWVFDPANFFDDKGTHTQGFLVSAPTKVGLDIAVVFRGSELYNPLYLLVEMAAEAVDSPAMLLEKLQKCVTAPITSGQKVVAAFLQKFDWMQDWLLDAKIIAYSTKSWPANAPTNLKVASGFLDAWLGVKDQVKSRLLRLIPAGADGVRVFVTGHSLGSAIAVLSAVDIWKEMLDPLTPKPKLSVYAIANPVVGNAKFAEYYNALMLAAGAESYTIRDPKDSIIALPNAFLTGEIPTPGPIWNDPYGDVANGYCTLPGSGHWIANYISLFNDDSRPRIVPAPDAPLEVLVLRTVTSDSYNGFNPLASHSPWLITLVVGMNPDSTGGTTLSLSESNQMVPFLIPGQTDTFEATVPSGLKVSDLERCALSLTSPPLHLHPIVLNGLQLYVNGYDLFADYGMAVSLDPMNSLYRFNVPIPYYVIVGGDVEVADKNGKNSVVMRWGKETKHKISMSNGWTWSEKYTKSYGVTNSYLTPVAANSQGVEKRVVGGRFQATDLTSKATYVEISSWGERTSEEVNVSEGYAWSPQYDYKTIGYASFFLKPVAQVAADAPKIIGGLRLATLQKDRVPPYIETNPWGKRSQYQVFYTQGCSKDGILSSDNYWYGCFFFDGPVNQQSNVDINLSVRLVSLHCGSPSESSTFTGENADEVYLWANGRKYWPVENSYSSMTTDTTAPIGRTITVTNLESVELELWDKDTLSGDDKLYKFPFSLSTLIYDPESNSSDFNQRFIPLSMCQPGKTYWARGINLDDPNSEYAYHLEITVQSS